MLDLFAGRKFFLLVRIKKNHKILHFFVDFRHAGMVFYYNGVVAKILFFDRFPL